MALYPDAINKRLTALRQTGKAAGTNAVGTGVGLTCGSFVRFYLHIDLASNTIVQARFKSNGCGYAIAAADTLSENITGMNIADLHGLDAAEFLEISVEYPSERRHCGIMGLDALRGALADFRALRLEEFSGEKALICTCFGVTEERIEQVIADVHAESVDEVTRVCNAGGGCGSCRMLIREMIDHAIS